MKTAIVGYTGFVGSNICAAGEFDGLFNSKNIEEAYGTNPELLVYAGLRAEKFLANNAPKKDMELILNAEKNITSINPQKLVLISTIDVFRTPCYVDEDSIIDTEGLHAYGYNRYQLEEWVRNNYPDALIVRLPGLFGRNLKKNFIFDYINYIPSMLNESKYTELKNKSGKISEYYKLQENGFYKVLDYSNDGELRILLKELFQEIGFSALNFTDSRSVYQFYNLSRLWRDIVLIMNSGIKLWHPATEPVSAGEIYQYLTGHPFVNELGGIPANYDYRTKYSSLFGRNDGYILGKETVLEEIKQYVESVEK